MTEMLTWVDPDGVEHSIPRAAAIGLLRDLYYEWPGGLDEIRSYMEQCNSTGLDFEEHMKVIGRDITKREGIPGIYEDSNTRKRWLGWRAAMQVKLIAHRVGERLFRKECCKMNPAFGKCVNCPDLAIPPGATE